MGILYSWLRRAVGIGALLCLFSGCGDFVWFVSWNTGPIDPNGLVVVVGTVREVPPEEIILVEGEIPKGMAIMRDGTVEGVPEETGNFEFTLEFVNPDGSSEQETFKVELI